MSAFKVQAVIGSFRLKYGCHVARPFPILLKFRFHTIAFLGSLLKQVILGFCLFQFEREKKTLLAASLLPKCPQWLGTDEAEAPS